MSSGGNYGGGGGNYGGSGNGGGNGYGYAPSKPRVQGPLGGVRGVAVPGGHLPADYFQGLKRVGGDDEYSGTGDSFE